MTKIFKPDELTFAAFARCKCGAGLCYVNDNEVRAKETGEQWICSTILLSEIKLKVTRAGGFLSVGTLEDENGVEHVQSYPFVTHEIKAEFQPSSNGATTRLNGLLYHKDCGQPAFQCKCSQMRDLELRE